MPLPEIPPGLGVPDAVADRIREAFATVERGLASEARIDLTGMPQISAATVRWLLLKAMPAFDGIASRLALWHATIEGWLDLGGARLSATPCLAGCRFLPGADQTAAGIDLTDATAVGFQVIGG